MRNFRIPCLAAAVLVSACGSSAGGTATTSDVSGDSSVKDGSGSDASGDSTSADSVLADSTASDAAPDTSGSDAGPIDADPSKDFGFVVRKPAEHVLKCTNPSPMAGDTLTASDADFICTFAYKGQTGHVYLQNTASGCTSGGMSNLATFTGTGAWISLANGVFAMSGASYDWGGNHHNDSLEFDWQGTHFRLFHSSFGFGWRKCQPMDCIQVTKGVGGDLVEDGCTKDRTLPIWCSQVEADGSYPPPVDAFKKCLGDPNGG